MEPDKSHCFKICFEQQMFSLLSLSMFRNRCKNLELVEKITIKVIFVYKILVGEEFSLIIYSIYLCIS